MSLLLKLLKIIVTKNNFNSLFKHLRLARSQLSGENKENGNLAHTSKPDKNIVDSKIQGVYAIWIAYYNRFSWYKSSEMAFFNYSLSHQQWKCRNSRIVIISLINLHRFSRHSNNSFCSLPLRLKIKLIQPALHQRSEQVKIIL